MLDGAAAALPQMPIARAMPNNLPIPTSLFAPDITGFHLPVTCAARQIGEMPGSDHDELAAPLARMGLIAPGDVFAVTRLSGGVSCDVWKVEPEGKPPLVVKRALAKLRVAADWRAPPERWKAEVAWLKLAAGIDPATAPAILGVDEAAALFAMAFLDGCPLWKAELAAGRVDVAFAATTGRKLATIHAATAGRAD